MMARAKAWAVALALGVCLSLLSVWLVDSVWPRVDRYVDRAMAEGRREDRP
jgi:hypothetical protein